jgi:hypothetical protein
VETFYFLFDEARFNPSTKSDSWSFLLVALGSDFVPCCTSALDLHCESKRDLYTFAHILNEY